MHTPTAFSAYLPFEICDFVQATCWWSTLSLSPVVLMSVGDLCVCAQLQVECQHRQIKLVTSPVKLSRDVLTAIDDLCVHSAASQLPT